VTAPAILPLGEGALTLRLADVASVALAERSAQLALAVREWSLDGVHDIVPSVASLTVFYDPLVVDHRALATRLDALARGPTAAQGGHPVGATHVVNVRYDGADLDDVAARTRLSRDEVIQRHSTREYHVMALGFLPGWAYLGPLDDALALPRRTTPRARIPAGAVAIAGTQTGIYPRESPGGWHLIGSTHIVLFTPERTPPVLFRPGDRVRFVPVP
jgi:KipI family sensor histidine kinase inhibitor